MTPVPYRVTGVVPDDDDTVTLTLFPVGEILDVCEPGQFMMVWVFGVGEIPISVSGVADGAVILTVRAVGAVSAAIVGSHVGDLVGLRGPYGTAWPLAAAAGRDVLVAAGGLGLAPLRMAIDALLGDTGASLTVIVGAREPRQLLYPDDRRRWADHGARVHLTVDAADGSWNGSLGTVTALLERLGESHDVAFVCGPEPMMTSAVKAAVNLGTDPARAWVSLERNMHCGIAQCGRCQLGPLLLCRDGAVVRWDAVAAPLEVSGR